MDNSLIFTGEYVTKQELMLGEAAQIQERQRKEQFEQDSVTLGAEYDQQFGEEYIAPARGNMSRRKYREAIAVDRARFEQKQRIQRNLYVRKNSKFSGANYTAEQKKRFDQGVREMASLAVDNPMHQQNLNAINNFKASNYAHMDVASYMSLLMSKDTRAMALAGQSRNAVVGSFKEATAADKETMRVKEAPLIMIPDIKKKEVDVRRGVAGDDVSREKLIEAQEKYAEMQNNLATDHKAFAKSYTETRFKDSGIELSKDDVEYVADSTGADALLDKSLSKEIVLAFNQLKNDENHSFMSRNEAVLTMALENAGIKPGEMGQYRYRNFAQNGMGMIMGLRDAQFNLAATTNLMNTKQAQSDAHEFVVGKIHDFVLQSVSNPTALANSMERSNGTSDAMTALTLIGAEGRMDVIKGLNEDDFKGAWDKMPTDRKLTYFTDKVLDVMMDATRHLQGDKQKHAMSVVRKLRTTSSMGQLDVQEPVIANEINTLFGQFMNTTNVEWGEEAASQQESLLSTHTLTRQYGNKKYTITATAPTGNPNTDLTSMAQLADTMSLLDSNHSNAGKFDQLGVVGKNGTIDASSMHTKSAYNLVGNIVANPYAENDTYKEIYDKGNRADLESGYHSFNNFTQEGYDQFRRANAAVGGSVTPVDYMKHVTGKSEMSDAVAEIVQDNEIYSRALRTFDPAFAKSVWISALDDYNKMSSASAVNLIQSAQLSKKQQMERGIMQPTTGYGDFVNFPSDLEKKAYSQYASDSYTGLLERDEGTTIDELDKSLTELGVMRRVAKENLKDANAAKKLRTGRIGTSDSMVDDSVAILENDIKVFDAAIERFEDTRNYAMSFRRVGRVSNAEEAARLRQEFTTDRFSLIGVEDDPSRGGVNKRFVGVRDLLRAHSDKDFVKRIFNPTMVEPIKTEDGGFKTHFMSHTETDGRWIVYPNVVNKGGKLEELSGSAAVDYALETGEYIEVGSEKEADMLARRYKTMMPLTEFYNAANDDL
jgi:hypothetical protein